MACKQLPFMYRDNELSIFVHRISHAILAVIRKLALSSSRVYSKGRLALIISKLQTFFADK